MDCYRSILGLRAVRRYLPDPLSDEEVARILEAGRWTGSAKNRQPWSLVMVTDPEQRRRLSECGSFASHLPHAPLVIVLVSHPDGYELDIGRLMQNMMLAAQVDGIGSCPVTLHREDCAHRVLGIPDDHRARYAISFGRIDEQAEREAREAMRSVLARPARKPLEELVHRDRWGQTGEPTRSGGQ